MKIDTAMFGMREKGGWRTMVFKNRGALLIPVAIVLLVFGRPSISSAVAGIIVAALGELVRVWAVGYSGVTTRADVVVAPALVTNGPYAVVRNPIYVANAVIALGFWYAFSGGVSLAEALVMLVLVLAFVVGVYSIIIPLEEAYLAGHFGEPYRAYMASVPRLIPSGSAVPPANRLGTWRGDVIARAEVITLAFFILMIVAVFLKLGIWSGAGIYF